MNSRIENKENMISTPFVFANRPSITAKWVETKEKNHRFSFLTFNPAAAILVCHSLG
jgi:hypothetical protein